MPQGFVFPPADGEFFILLYDFKGDIANILHNPRRCTSRGRKAADAIDFNNAHANVEMPFFNQDIFDLAQTVGSILTGLYPQTSVYPTTRRSKSIIMPE